MLRDIAPDDCVEPANGSAPSSGRKSARRRNGGDLTVQVGTQSYSALHPNRRRPRQGPELELVKSFCSSLPIGISEGLRRTCFMEPKLQSGYPDLVIVDWCPTIASKWPRERRNITADDLRLVHTLYSGGARTENELSVLLNRPVKQSIRRAESCGLVQSSRQKWSASSLSDIFAVHKIVAFEAKINNSRVAIEQAALNLWFASESYVLLAREPTAEAMTVARSARVGIWVGGLNCPVVKAVAGKRRQPVSYASWLFNEWAWRYLSP